MAYSALALGHESLRLRSRRVRSDRSHRLSMRFTLAVMLAATAMGFVGSSLAAHSSAIVDPPQVDEQRYLTALGPIHSQLERSIDQMGLLASFYGAGEIDRFILKARLDEFLLSYQTAELQMREVDPPPQLRGVHQGYLEALRLLQQSTVELMKVYDDGSDAHLSDAAALSLQSTQRLRDLDDQLGSASAR